MKQDIDALVSSLKQITDTMTERDELTIDFVRKVRMTVKAIHKPNSNPDAIADVLDGFAKNFIKQMWPNYSQEQR